MRVLGLCGSLRADSSNGRLLQAAVMLSPPRLQCDVVTTLGELPHFNPDSQLQDFPVLVEFVDAVRSCAGLVVSSPVYAGGYPGTLKNALDWLVGTDAFVAKPFVMLSASNRVPGVQDALIKVLQTMSGVHVAEASAVVPLLGRDLSVEQIIGEAGFARTIRTSMMRLADHLALR